MPRPNESFRVKSDVIFFIVCDLPNFFTGSLSIRLSKTAKFGVCSMKAFRDTGQEVTRGVSRFTDKRLNKYNFEGS